MVDKEKLFEIFLVIVWILSSILYGTFMYISKILSFIPELYEDQRINFIILISIFSGLITIMHIDQWREKHKKD